MLFIVALGRFYTFLQSKFFLSQLASAQRVSALFPLLKFCCVAILIFYCFAWHFYIESAFIKKYENFGTPSSFSIFFFNYVFMFVLQRKLCQALRRLCVPLHNPVP